MKSIQKRPAKVRILSTVTQYGEDGDASVTGSETTGKPETMTLTTDCTVADKGGRIEIDYAESEITGMEGALTKICFDKKNPELVSILRTGTVSTALVFEAGKRHICAYETPYFPIELCVDTAELVNRLHYDGGSLHAIYRIEMNGMLAEATDLSVTLL